MAVKPRPDRQQDVADEAPEWRQSHEQARQRPVARGPRIRRTVAATKRPSPAATIRIGKPTGSIGFGFQTCEAASAAASPMLPSHAPQTVNTHRPSIDRLTAMKLLGPTFDQNESGLRPVAVQRGSPCGRSPGDNDVVSLTKVRKMCQSDSAEGF